MRAHYQSLCIPSFPVTLHSLIPQQALIYFLSLWIFLFWTFI